MRTTAGKQIAEDAALSRAIADGQDLVIQDRLAAASREAGARRVRLQLTGQGTFEVGTGPAVGAARNALLDQDERPLGRLVTAVETAQSFAAAVREITEVGVVIVAGDQVIASSGERLTRVQLPDRGDVSIEGRDYRVSTLNVTGFDGRPLEVRLALAEDDDSSLLDTTSLIVIGSLLGFLLLAIAFAYTVSRTLQAEVARLLRAAREIGRGDFAVDVPDGGQRRVRRARQRVQLDGPPARGAAGGAPARARPPPGGDPARRRVVHQEPGPRRPAGDRRPDRRRRPGGRLRAAPR